MTKLIRFLLHAAAVLAPGFLIALLATRAVTPAVPPQRGPGMTRRSALEARQEVGEATPDELVELAEIHLENGQPLKAAALASEARKLSPRSPGPPNLLGLAYASLGDIAASHGNRAAAREAYGRARRSFDRAARLAPPEQLAPALNLARFLIARGDSAAALLLLQRVTSQAPENAEVRMLTGKARRLRKLHLPAAAAFRRALELNPALAEARAALGILLADLDHPHQAVPELREAYRLGDRDPIALSYLALALLTGLGDDASYAEAERLLQEAGDPRIAPAWFAKGLLRQRAGDYPAARREFLKILRKDPRHQRAVFALAQTYRAEGKVGAYKIEMRRYQRMTRPPPAVSDPGSGSNSNSESNSKASRLRSRPR